MADDRSRKSSAILGLELVHSPFQGATQVEM
jgi:hypothetical protein